jgi:hypothetical protein
MTGRSVERFFPGGVTAMRSEDAVTASRLSLLWREVAEDAVRFRSPGGATCGGTRGMRRRGKRMPESEYCQHHIQLPLRVVSFPRAKGPPPRGLPRPGAALGPRLGGRDEPEEEVFF